MPIVLSISRSTLIELLEIKPRPAYLQEIVVGAPGAHSNLFGQGQEIDKVVIRDLIQFVGMILRHNKRVPLRERVCMEFQR